MTEELIRRYGPCLQIVTDNGAPYVKAMAQLTKKWPTIEHIRITPYNSQANGIVERAHRTLQESLYKIAPGSTWLQHLDPVVIAERMAIRRSLGASPFFLAHGFNPTLPVDMTELTMLATAIQTVESPNELLETRLLDQEDRERELRETAEAVRARRAAQNDRANSKVATGVKKFGPGALVMIRDPSRDVRHDGKPLDRYIGPYVVLKRGRNGAYTVLDFNKPTGEPIKVGGRRVGPYHARRDHTDEIELILAEHDLLDPSSSSGDSDAENSEGDLTI